jgi:hypothetical protein
MPLDGHRGTGWLVLLRNTRAAHGTRTSGLGAATYPGRGRRAQRFGGYASHLASSHSRGAPYCMNQPWLTTRDWPVSALQPNTAKNRVAAATSSQSCRRQLGDETPERAQLVDAPLRRDIGNDRGVDSPDRNARRPIGIQIGLGQCLVDAGPIGAKRAAALQQQDSRGEGWPARTANIQVLALRYRRTGICHAGVVLIDDLWVSTALVLSRPCARSAAQWCM